MEGYFRAHEFSGDKDKMNHRLYASARECCRLGREESRVWIERERGGLGRKDGEEGGSSSTGRLRENTKN